MRVQNVLQVVQTLVVIALAPLYSEAIARAEAIVQSKRGPSLLQPAGRSGPVRYRTRVLPLFERYLYGPVIRVVECLGRLVRPIQSGDVNLYLLYVLAAVLVALFVASR